MPISFLLYPQVKCTTTISGERQSTEKELCSASLCVWFDGHGTPGRSRMASCGRREGLPVAKTGRMGYNN